MVYGKTLDRYLIDRIQGINTLLWRATLELIERDFKQGQHTLGRVNEKLSDLQHFISINYISGKENG